MALAKWDTNAPKFAAIKSAKAPLALQKGVNVG